MHNLYKLSRQDSDHVFGLGLIDDEMMARLVCPLADPAVCHQPIFFAKGDDVGL